MATALQSTSNVLTTSNARSETVTAVPTRASTQTILSESFLVHKASREEQTFVRPVNLPRSASLNGGAKVVDTPDLSVEEDRSTTSSLNKIETKTDGASKKDASTLRKATRQSDVSLSDEQSTGS